MFDLISHIKRFFSRIEIVDLDTGKILTKPRRQLSNKEMQRRLRQQYTLTSDQYAQCEILRLRLEEQLRPYAVDDPYDRRLYAFYVDLSMATIKLRDRLTEVGKQLQTLDELINAGEGRKEYRRN